MEFNKKQKLIIDLTGEVEVNDLTCEDDTENKSLNVQHELLKLVKVAKPINPIEIKGTKPATEMVTEHDLAKMAPNTWLNDACIDGFLKLCLKGNNDKFHVFSALFYTYLVGDGYKYEKVSKWTKGVDIFARRAFFFPINVGKHWMMCYANTAKKMVYYLDSLCFEARGNEVLGNIRRYMEDEHMAKKGTPLEGWEYKILKNVPQQEGIDDCGVFCSFFIWLLLRGIEMDEHIDPISAVGVLRNVKQANMRHKMTEALINGFVE